MASLSRSSFRQLVRSNTSKPSSTLFFSTTSDEISDTRKFSTIPQSMQQKTELRMCISKTNTDELKRTASKQLVNALENIIDVQKSLGVSDGENVFVRTDSDREQENEAFLKHFTHAVRNLQTSEALNMFYSTPQSILSGDFGIQNNLLYYQELLRLVQELHVKKIASVVDVYEASELVYANCMNSLNEGENKKLDSLRKNILHRVLFVLSRSGSNLPYQRLVNTIEDLSSTIECMTETDDQLFLYAELMKELLHKNISRIVRKSIHLKSVEKDIWQSAITMIRMTDRAYFEDNPNIFSSFISLLEKSTFTIQKDLPFAELMKSLVDKGAQPPPEVVLNIFQFSFPYNDITNARYIIRSLNKLQNNKDSDMPDYVIDVGNLESIAYPLSRKGMSRELMDLWSYIQTIQASGYPHYQVTEGFLESLARSFVASRRQEDELLFGVLATMEEQGMKPSYIFIKGLAQSLRTKSTIARLDKGRHILFNSLHENSNPDGSPSLVTPCSTSLNTLLAGYADLGLSEKAFQLLDSFEQLGCEPDANTYAFLVQAICRNLTTSLPVAYVSNDMNRFLIEQEELADYVINETIRKGFHNHKHLIDAYVKVLCATNNLEKAREFLSLQIAEANETGDIPSTSLDTLSTLALEHALRGNFDGLEEVSQLCTSSGYSGLPSSIHSRIQRIKLRYSS